MKLRNQVVWITDAGNGSGRAIINRLAAEGAQFILTGAGAETLKPIGAKVFAAADVNLCNSAEVSAMLGEAAQQVGTVDILVHNNNVVKPAGVETCSEEVFLEVMNANAKSAFVCTRAAGQQMKTKQSGKVVYVNSIHAEKPTGSSFAYSASKGAVKMLCREAALGLGRDGINVNAIELGPVEGDDLVFESSISPLYESYQYKVPNAVLGTYDDLANLVLFLSTEEARYLNGADLRLDGGFLMHYADSKMKRPQPGEAHP